MIFENKYKKLTVQEWTKQMRDNFLAHIESKVKGKIYVVGSRTMGFHKDDSDLDVYVETKSKSKSIFSEFKGIRVNIKTVKSYSNIFNYKGTDWNLPYFDLKENKLNAEKDKKFVDKYYKETNREKLIIITEKDANGNSCIKKYTQDNLPYKYKVQMDLLIDRPIIEEEIREKNMNKNIYSKKYITKVAIVSMFIFLLLSMSVSSFIFRAPRDEINLLDAIVFGNAVGISNRTLTDTYIRGDYRINVYQEQVCRTVTRRIPTRINRRIPIISRK